MEAFVQLINVPFTLSKSHVAISDECEFNKYDLDNRKDGRIIVHGNQVKHGHGQADKDGDDDEGLSLHDLSYRAAEQGVSRCIFG